MRVLRKGGARKLFGWCANNVYELCFTFAACVSYLCTDTCMWNAKTKQLKERTISFSQAHRKIRRKTELLSWFSIAFHIQWLLFCIQWTFCAKYVLSPHSRENFLVRILWFVAVCMYEFCIRDDGCGFPISFSLTQKYQNEWTKQPVCISAEEQGPGEMSARRKLSRAIIVSVQDFFLLLASIFEKSELERKHTQRIIFTSCTEDVKHFSDSSPQTRNLLQRDAHHTLHSTTQYLHFTHTLEYRIALYIQLSDKSCKRRIVNWVLQSRKREREGQRQNQKAPRRIFLGFVSFLLLLSLYLFIIIISVFHLENFVLYTQRRREPKKELVFDILRVIFLLFSFIYLQCLWVRQRALARTCVL